MMDRESAVVVQRKGAKAKRASRRGLTVPRYFSTAGVDPAEELAWERRSASITGEGGQLVFEQKRRRGPQGLVGARHQRGGLQVLPGRARLARARALGPAAGRPGGPDHRRLGPQGRLLRHRRRRRRLRGRAVAPPLPPEDVLQLPRLVQRGRGGAPAVHRLLHQLRRRLDGLHPEARPHRGHALQVRVRHRLQPLAHPLLARSALSGGGEASGPVSFMRGFDAFAGVIKRGGKTRRAAKMVILDADHPDIDEFVELQGHRGEEGLGAHRGRLRRRLQRPRRRLRLGLLPERQPLGARDRRLHAGGRGRRRVGAHGAHRRRARWSGSRPATSCARMAEAAWLCGDPGMQFDTTVNAWHTCREHGADQRLQPLLGVHVPRRLGLQPGLAQPDALPVDRRRVRRRDASAGR